MTVNYFRLKTASDSKLHECIIHIQFAGEIQTLAPHHLQSIH